MRPVVIARAALAVVMLSTAISFSRQVKQSECSGRSWISRNYIPKPDFSVVSESIHVFSYSIEEEGGRSFLCTSELPAFRDPAVKFSGIINVSARTYKRVGFSAIECRGEYCAYSQFAFNPPIISRSSPEVLKIQESWPWSGQIGDAAGLDANVSSQLPPGSFFSTSGQIVCGKEKPRSCNEQQNSEKGKYRVSYFKLHPANGWEVLGSFIVCFFIFFFSVPLGLHGFRLRRQGKIPYGYAVGVVSIILPPANLVAVFFGYDVWSMVLRGLCK